MSWFDIRRKALLLLTRFENAVTGVILTLLNGTGLPLVSFKATGNSTQATTTGKNLFDGQWEIGGIDSVTGANWTEPTHMRFKNYIPVSALTTYILSRAWTADLKFRFYDASFAYLGFGSYTGTTATTFSFTTLANTKYMRIMAYNTTDTTLKLQIEIGATASAYEPYSGGLPAPNPAYPKDITSVGDKVVSTDSDWSTPIVYGKTSWVGTAPSAVGADCYRVPITVRGKNVIDFDAYLAARSVVYSKSDDIYTMNTAVGLFNNKKILFSAPKTISVRAIITNTTTINALVQFFNGTTYVGSLSASAAVLQNIVADNFRFNWSDAGGNIFTVKDFQIEIASTSSAYEPYHTPLSYNLYLDAPLRYNDTINHLGAVEYKSEEVVLDGETYGKMFTDFWGDNLEYYNRAKITGISSTPFNYVDAKCTHFPYKTSVDSDSTDEVGFMTVDSGVYIRFGSTGLSTVTAANNWIKALKTAGTPVKIIYTLATPVPGASITMPTIGTFPGTTLIQLDTTVQPSVLEAEYWSTEEA